MREGDRQFGDRPTLTGMETKNEHSGEKKDRTRGGIKGSALMQSSAHLSSVGGNDQQPCNYTVISDRGTDRRGFCGLFTELNGDKPVFKFDTQNCS